MQKWLTILKFVNSKPNSTDFTFSIIVKDIDPKGKTENKDFKGHIWKY